MHLPGLNNQPDQETAHLRINLSAAPIAISERVQLIGAAITNKAAFEYASLSPNISLPRIFATSWNTAGSYSPRGAITNVPTNFLAWKPVPVSEIAARTAGLLTNRPNHNLFFKDPVRLLVISTDQTWKPLWTDLDCGLGVGVTAWKLDPQGSISRLKLVAPEMGLKYRIFLSGRKVYCCKGCENHMALHESLMSKVSLGIPLVCRLAWHTPLSSFSTTIYSANGQSAPLLASGRTWKPTELQRSAWKSLSLRPSVSSHTLPFILVVLP